MKTTRQGFPDLTDYSGKGVKGTRQEQTCETCGKKERDCLGHTVYAGDLE